MPSSVDRLVSIVNQALAQETEWVTSYSVLEDEPNVIGLETSDGEEFFIEVMDA